MASMEHSRIRLRMDDSCNCCTKAPPDDHIYAYVSASGRCEPLKLNHKDPLTRRSERRAAINMTIRHLDRVFQEESRKQNVPIDNIRDLVNREVRPISPMQYEPLTFGEVRRIQNLLKKLHEYSPKETASNDSPNMIRADRKVTFSEKDYAEALEKEETGGEKIGELTETKMEA